MENMAFYSSADNGSGFQNVEIAFDRHCVTLIKRISFKKENPFVLVYHIHLSS
jgi:hypothetical protein